LGFTKGEIMGYTDSRRFAFMAQKQKKKWIIRAVIAILFVIAAVVAFLLWKNFSEVQKDNHDGESLSQTVEGGNFGDNKKDADEEGDEKKVKQYEGEDPNEKDTLTGVVTYAGVVEDELVIRINIDQYLYEGDCSLELSRSGIVVYNARAMITATATTATCEGFNIPVNEIGNGEIMITIKVDAGGKTGIISGGVEI
jgi:hypothetical protein